MNLSRRSFILSTASALSTAAICSLSLPKRAEAAGVQGSYSYATVYGYQYKYNSSAANNGTQVWSHTSVAGVNSYEIPAGYIGICARLFKSSGVLASSAGWKYTTTVVGGVAYMTDPYYRGTGTFYGKGQVRFYNGNGYTTYTSTSSPYLQTKSLSPITRNERGEALGSALFHNEDELDLIEAVGISGIIGYVRTSDLNYGGVPSSVEQAIAQSQSIGQTEQSIPVYKEDGLTVVDSFIVTYGNIRCM